jgi:cysteine desulfurase/selenocysteine lyase
MLKSPPRIDIDQIRLDFPILATEVGGKPLVYLDNAATSQKPRPVIDGQTAYWETSNANVHRGVHHLSQRATHAFDAARDAVRVLLNAASSAEVIFTKGCTEGINLVATGLTSAASPAGTTGPAGTPWIGEGDEILLSAMEHHSNIVPWQMAASRVGATVRVIPISDAGEIDLVAYSEMLSPRTRVVGIVRRRFVRAVRPTGAAHRRRAVAGHRHAGNGGQVPHGFNERAARHFHFKFNRAAALTG